MKVYVSQGHEKGIGLEVFLKACLLLSDQDLALIQLQAFKTPVEETLKQQGFKFTIGADHIHYGGIKMAVNWLPPTDAALSFSSLQAAMQLAEQGGVLYTLPTSKDQFPQDAGHTEFFRRHYQAPQLGMYFSSPQLKVLLVTDHLPLNVLSQTLTEDAIFQRIDQALQTLSAWRCPPKRVLIAGLNPHAGEQGMIGDEDKRVTTVVKRLATKYKFAISGPWPGDTMVLEQKSADDLLVYLYHDQGLGVFKSLQGFIGSNITLGLPYPRLSPDHGTSFSLYGKNVADYRGCAYSLKEAISLLKRVKHGKNSSYQGQSS